MDEQANRKRPTYSDEFKQDAVRFVIDEGYSFKKACQAVGVWTFATSGRPAGSAGCGSRGEDRSVRCPANEDGDAASRHRPLCRRAVAAAGRGEDVVKVLEAVSAQRGFPKSIRVDNGPEFISKSLDWWAYFNGVKLDFSRPGKPTDSAFIESFNGSSALSV